MKPKNVQDQAQWEAAVDRFSSAAFQAVRDRNKANRAKKKSVSRQGSKSYAAWRHEEKDETTGEPLGIIENFKNHHCKGGKWTDDHARARYENMLVERDRATQAASSQGGSVDAVEIERQAVESVMRSGRGYRGGVGPILGKFSQLSADLSESSAASSRADSASGHSTAAAGPSTSAPSMPEGVPEWMTLYASAVQWMLSEFRRTGHTPPDLPPPPAALIPAPPPPPADDDDDDEEDEADLP